MRIDTHKHYDKAWPKLTEREQARVLEALKLFLEDPAHPRLRVHPLKGEWYPEYSLSVGGDLRVHFMHKDNDTIILTAVGTHAQLYG